MKSLTLYFSDRPYVSSHLKAPKGFGVWAFSENQRGDDMIFTPHAMTLTNAKKWLKSKLATEGVTGTYTVYILS
jgi:hypothetical protein